MTTGTDNTLEKIPLTRSAQYINTRENQKVTQGWTMQRHWEHKTIDTKK
jgi:hypothetical protein